MFWVNPEVCLWGCDHALVTVEEVDSVTGVINGAETRFGEK
jgi:hypothetical protein